MSRSHAWASLPAVATAKGDEGLTVANGSDRHCSAAERLQHLHPADALRRRRRRRRRRPDDQRVRPAVSAHGRTDTARPAGAHTPCPPEPGGSAGCCWNRYGTHCNHPAQGRIESLSPSRVDQQAAIGIDTEHSAATRLSATLGQAVHGRDGAERWDGGGHGGGGGRGFRCCSSSASLRGTGDLCLAYSCSEICPRTAAPGTIEWL